MEVSHQLHALSVLPPAGRALEPVWPIWTIEKNVASRYID
jgi:hypothetical protein